MRIDWNNGKRILWVKLDSQAVITISKVNVFGNDVYAVKHATVNYFQNAASALDFLSGLLTNEEAATVLEYISRDRDYGKMCIS